MVSLQNQTRGKRSFLATQIKTNEILTKGFLEDFSPEDFSTREDFSYFRMLHIKFAVSNNNIKLMPKRTVVVCWFVRRKYFIIIVIIFCNSFLCGAPKTHFELRAREPFRISTLAKEIPKETPKKFIALLHLCLFSWGGN